MDVFRQSLIFPFTLFLLKMLDQAIHSLVLPKVCLV